MLNIPHYDTNKYRLGKLCSNEHDFHGTGRSLRYKVNRVCTKCGTKRRAKDKKKLIEEGRCIDCYQRAEKGSRLCESCSLNSSLRGYGITLDYYRGILDSQNGLCAICGTSPEESTRLEIDHCHSGGRVRGLLCHACNVGLGYFHDNTDKLASAIVYLNVG